MVQTQPLPWDRLVQPGHCRTGNDSGGALWSFHLQTLFFFKPSAPLHVGAPRHLALAALSSSPLWRGILQTSLTLRPTWPAAHQTSAQMLTGTQTTHLQRGSCWWWHTSLFLGLSALANSTCIPGSSSPPLSISTNPVPQGVPLMPANSSWTCQLLSPWYLFKIRPSYLTGSLSLLTYFSLGLIFPNIQQTGDF